MHRNETSKLYNATAAVLLLIAAIGGIVAWPRTLFMIDVPVRMPFRFDRPGTYTTTFTTIYSAGYLLEIHGKAANREHSSFPLTGQKIPMTAITWSIRDHNGDSHGSAWDQWLWGHNFAGFQSVAREPYQVTLTVKQPQPQLQAATPSLLIYVNRTEMEHRALRWVLVLLGAVFTLLISIGFFIAAFAAIQRERVVAENTERWRQ